MRSLFGLLLKKLRKKEKLLFSEEEMIAAIDRTKMPQHVAIIMDGNGRWAQRRGLPRAAGHRAGVESLREIVKICSTLGINVLTVYAFSTENWNRPREEIDVLMDLLVEYLKKELEELHNQNVQIRAIGRISELPQSAQKALHEAREQTKNNTGLKLNLALNYGGRMEITEAVRCIAQKIKEGELDPDHIDEKTVAQYLFTAGQPDPDLLIRPSGELRWSNFLLWQGAYAEFWVTSVFWPDFRRNHLLEAVLEFQQRQRRFGGLKSRK